jgi:histidine triad (HIT) family protein
MRTTIWSRSRTPAGTAPRYIPREHIATIRPQAGERALVGSMFRGRGAGETARVLRAGLPYRVQLQSEAGQSVFHIHLHLLAGRTLNWPPG